MNDIAQSFVNVLGDQCPGQRADIKTAFSHVQKKTSKRDYEAAKPNRLLSNWTGSLKGINSLANASLPTLRGKSRDLFQNNEWAKAYLHILKQNVIGDVGIRMRPRRIHPDGEIDRSIERGLLLQPWFEWCLKGVCTVDARHSFADLQRMLIVMLATDGEFLIRHVRGKSAGNEFNYAIQVIEADQLDFDYNKRLSNGNRIIMGVEVNRWMRPVAYHILTEHPYENYISNVNLRKRERVPADQIEHVFIADRPNQIRGIPWMHASMKRLKMLDGLEDAELTASRLEAAKMGFYHTPDGTPPPGVNMEGDETEREFIEEVEPGTFGVIPDGYNFTMFDPQHPNAAFAEFSKQMLRAFAASNNVAYFHLGNDTEGVTYATGRIALLNERDGWRVLHNFVINNICQPIYRNWLDMSSLSGRVVVKTTELIQYVYPLWKPRGWQWTDPQKESRGNEIATDNKYKSITDVQDEMGRDIEDTFADMQYEQELADKYDVDLSKYQPGVEDVLQVVSDDENSNEDENKDED